MPKLCKKSRSRNSSRSLGSRKHSRGRKSQKKSPTGSSSRRRRRHRRQFGAGEGQANSSQTSSSSSSSQSGRGWWDYFQKDFPPVNGSESGNSSWFSFNSTSDYIADKLKFSVPSFPGNLTQTQQKLAEAIKSLWDDPTNTRYLPWYAVGTAVVCLGLKAAWPSIRASYLKAEKSAQRYSDSLIKQVRPQARKEEGIVDSINTTF